MRSLSNKVADTLSRTIFLPYRVRRALGVNHMSSTTDDKSLEGLGGWLVLVGLGLVVTPLKTLYALLPLYVAMFRDGTWEILTTPGKPAYSPLWSPYIIGEMFFNAVLIAATIYAIYLFFNKRREFPNLYVWITAGGFVFVIVDALLIKLVAPQLPIFDPDTLKELARGAFGVCIWIPYMNVSKRVKATFVN